MYLFHLFELHEDVIFAREARDKAARQGMPYWQQQEHFDECKNKLRSATFEYEKENNKGTKQ